MEIKNGKIYSRDASGELIQIVPETTVPWDEIQDKPIVFAPEEHTHMVSDITDMPTELPVAEHTHTFAEITDKPEEYPPSEHTHPFDEITDKPEEYPPSEHTHTSSEITDFYDEVLEYATNAATVAFDGVTSENNTFSGNNSFTGNNTLSGRNTFSGVNTFTNENEFRGDVTFSGGNEFTGSNNFASDNTFAGNNTFGGSNTFTGSNTFEQPVIGDLDGNAEYARKFSQYSATENYAAGSIVTGSDGNTYMAVQANGPASTVKNPVTDTTGAWSTIAIDSSVVHITGNEDVAGNKTFIATPSIKTATPALLMKDTSIEAKGDPIDTTQYGFVNFGGQDLTTAQVTSLARVGVDVSSDATTAHLTAYKNVASNSANAKLTVNYPLSGSPYATAPKTPSAAAGNEIVTANYLAENYQAKSITVPGSTVSRLVAEHLADSINVKDFGAKGDGTTDDLDAIKAAMNAGRGKTVFFPAGKYIITKTIVVPAGTIVVGAGEYDQDHEDETTGVIIYGSGPGNPAVWTDINVATDSPITPMFVMGGNGVKLCNLSFRSGGWSCAIFNPSQSQCGAENCFSDDSFTNAGLWVDATWSPGNTALCAAHSDVLPDNGPTENYYVDCFFRCSADGYGIKVKGTDRPADYASGAAWVWGPNGTSDMLFLHCRSKGFQFDGNREGNQMSKAQVIGCSFRMSKGQANPSRMIGIDLRKSWGVSFYGCYAEVANSEDSFIYVHMSSSTTRYNTFVDCNFTTKSRLVLDGAVSTNEFGVDDLPNNCQCINQKYHHNQVANLTVKGNLALRGSVTSDINAGGALNVDGATTLAGNLEVSGNTYFVGTVRPKENEGVNLGTGSYRFNNVRAKAVVVDTVSADTVIAPGFVNMVNVKDFGAKGDGVTDDTYAIQQAFDTGKTVYIPEGVYVCKQELMITTAGQRIVGAGMGGAYNAQGYPIYPFWRDCTTLLFKSPDTDTTDPVTGRSFTPRRVRTRYLYRGSAADGQDPAMSVCVNVQAECVQIENIAIRNDVTLLAFSEWVKTTAQEAAYNAAHPNAPWNQADNYGADWDVGLFVATQPALTLQSVAVLGSHRMANIWVDSTQEGYSAQRFENWRTGVEFPGSRYGMPQYSDENCNILGNDKTLFQNVWTSGGLWGVRVEGAHLPEDDGRTEVQVSGVRGYYDHTKGLLKDNRGTFGVSDLCFISCYICGGDHFTKRRIADFDADTYTGHVDADHYVDNWDTYARKGGAYSINGACNNSSGAVHDHQYLNCRFHGYGPYVIRLGRTDRDHFLGCVTEQRFGYTHDGTAIPDSGRVPKYALGCLTRSKYCGSTQLIATRISYDEKYAHIQTDFVFANDGKTIIGSKPGEKNIVIGDYGAGNEYIGDSITVKNTIKKPVDNEYLGLYGATSLNTGACILMYGGDLLNAAGDAPNGRAGEIRFTTTGPVIGSSRPQYEMSFSAQDGALRPGTNEGMNLGLLDKRFNNVYAKNASFDTLKAPTNDSFLGLYGATNMSNGSTIILSGGDHGNKGRIRLVATGAKPDANSERTRSEVDLDPQDSAFYPATTDSIDLGKTTNRFNNAYIKAVTADSVTAGNILMSGTVSPAANETTDLGNTTNRFNNAYVKSVAADTVTVGSVTADTINAGDILMSGTVRPAVNEGANFGTSSYRFNIARAKNVVCDGITVSGSVLPDVTNTVDLGSDSLRLKNIYLVNAPDIISDERAKCDIEAIPDAVFRAWSKVGFSQFRLNEDVTAEGDDARTHIGVIAQRVMDAFASEGLDARKYSLLSYDEWADEYRDGVLVRAAGNRYGIRYEEALALECAYQRHELNKVKEKLMTIEELEQKLNEAVASGDIDAIIEIRKLLGHFE